MSLLFLISGGIMIAYENNLFLAEANNITLTEVLIMNMLSNSKLIVENIYYNDYSKRWEADIYSDGTIELGDNLGEAFDEAFTLSLESTRCNCCSNYTVLVDEEDNPLCGECGTVEMIVGE